VKFLSPIALILLFSLAFVVVGWFLLGRFAALLRDRKEDQSLHAVVLGLKGLKIEEHAKEIIQYLSRLRGDFAKFRDGFGLLEKLSNYRETCRTVGPETSFCWANQEFVEFRGYDPKVE
jgi:hypothetical protein